MINVFYPNGVKIPAYDDGTPVSPMPAWTQEVYDTIRERFLGGYFEQVFPPSDVPDPQWTLFNRAMLLNTYWQAWDIPADVRTAMISAFVAGKADAAQEAYNTGKELVVPSAEAIVEWQTLANRYHIPLGI